MLDELSEIYGLLISLNLMEHLLTNVNKALH